MNYENMSIEELTELRLDKQEMVEAAQAEMGEIAAVLKSKQRAADLERRLGGMTDEDKAELREILGTPATQSLSVSGIATEESVGEPKN
jgi:hypothetical protein